MGFIRIVFLLAMCVAVFVLYMVVVITNQEALPYYGKETIANIVCDGYCRVELTNGKFITTLRPAVPGEELCWRDVDHQWQWQLCEKYELRGYRYAGEYQWEKE